MNGRFLPVTCHAMFTVQIVQLTDNCGKFQAHGGEVVFDMLEGIGDFPALDQSIGSQFAQTFVEDFTGNTRNVAFQFPGTVNPLLNGHHYAGRPFAANDILEAVVGCAFAKGKELPLHWDIA